MLTAILLCSCCLCLPVSSNRTEPAADYFAHQIHSLIVSTSSPSHHSNLLFFVCFIMYCFYVVTVYLFNQSSNLYFLLFKLFLYNLNNIKIPKPLWRVLLLTDNCQLRNMFISNDQLVSKTVPYQGLECWLFDISCVTNLLYCSVAWCMYNCCTCEY